MTYYLVDCENIQPHINKNNISSDVNIILFYSAGQSYFVERAHKAHEKITKIEVKNPGKNSLDFHLVSYLTRLIDKKPSEEFIIVSNDHGFDTILKTFREEEGVLCKRDGLLSIPLDCVPNGVPNALYQKAVESILSTMLPKNKQKLFNFLKNYFPKYSDKEIYGVIEKLFKCKDILLSKNGRISLGKKRTHRKEKTKKSATPSRSLR